MTNAPEAPTDNHSVALERVIEAIRASEENRLGHIRGYLDVLSSGMKELRIEQCTGEFDDAVVASIESFIPRLAQFTELLSAITQYEADENYAGVLHKFFEDLIPYLYHPDGFKIDYNEIDVDNFRFIIHELFLYTIAILLKEEKFETVNHLVSNKYHAEPNAKRGGDIMVSYLDFCQPVFSINKTRNDRIEPKQKSLQTNILKGRAELLGVSFSHLMQADFILFMRKELTSPDSFWWPVTLLHANSTFEIFARAESIRYFDRIKCLLNIAAKEDMIPLLDAYDNRDRQFPKWDFECPDPRSLMGFDNLAETKP